MATRNICCGLLVLAAIVMPGCVVFEIRDELRKANTNLSTANTQLMVANTELDIANAKLLEANSRLSEANRDLTIVNGHLTQTIQRLDGTNGQMASLQDKHLTSLDTRLDPLGKSLTEVDAHLGSLRRTLDNIDSMIPFIGITDRGTTPGDSTDTPTSPTDPAAATPTAAPNGVTPPASPATTSAPTPGTPATKPIPAPKQETSQRMLPETITIEGAAVRLSAYLWRNFQPTVGAASDSKGLLASFKLIAADANAPQPNLKGIEVAAVRLHRGRSVWTGTAANETKPDSQTWERMIRPGPAWDIGPGVDVYVQLRLPEGSKKWIAAYNQTIERVD